jgi:hypothetical protein
MLTLKCRLNIKKLRVKPGDFSVFMANLAVSHSRTSLCSTVNISCFESKSKMGKQKSKKAKTARRARRVEKREEQGSNKKGA